YRNGTNDMAALKTLIRRWRSESGAEFVEFALAFPLLLLVVMGILDFGLMFQQYEVITNAAREGARVGMISSYTPANAQARALSYVNAALISQGANGAPTASATCTLVTVNGANVTAINVQVGYTHQFNFVGGLMGWGLGSKRLTAAATMRSESA